jgi:hypothetical protein
VEGEPVATKDVWVDDDRDREGWIRAKIEEGAIEEDTSLIQQYFMTVPHSDTGRINPPCICKGSRIDPPFDFDPHKFIHICTIQSNPMFGLQSEYTQSLRVRPILSQFSTIQSNPITGLCQLRQSPPSPLHTFLACNPIQIHS